MPLCSQNPKVTMPPWKRDSEVTSDLLTDLAQAAAAEEIGGRPISQSISSLRAAGLLLDDGRARPDSTAKALMRVASTNLSVARLWEGHINALSLIALYGAPSLKNTLRTTLASGAFFGVWGADGEMPVQMDPTRDHLSGSKKFASGLGTLSHAIVTVNSGPEVRLALIAVSDMARADPLAWNMLGMKATASGTYDFTGLALSELMWIGEPGDYLKEPHFVGGVWRIAALQIGAAIGLLDCAATQLRNLGRLQAEPQKARLMTVLMRAWAGISLVERAALASADCGLPAEQVVSTSISARLLTEEIALDAIQAVEQSLGLQHFDAGSQTGRMARDLSVYLRQAARDAFLQRAAEAALVQDGNIWGVFE